MRLFRHFPRFSRFSKLPNFYWNYIILHLHMYVFEGVKIDLSESDLLLSTRHFMIIEIFYQRTTTRLIRFTCFQFFNNLLKAGQGLVSCEETTFARLHLEPYWNTHWNIHWNIHCKHRWYRLHRIHVHMYMSDDWLGGLCASYCPEGWKPFRSPPSFVSSQVVDWSMPEYTLTVNA